MKNVVLDNGVEMPILGFGVNNIFGNELLLSIAGKYGRTVAQVILRWPTQRGVVAIPLPPRLKDTKKVLKKRD